MVIDFNRVNGGTPPVTGTTRTSSTRATEAATTDTSVSKPSAVGENVQLSDSAQFLQKVTSDLQSQPVVNSEKVAALKAQIADGSYQANPDSIASKIIASDF